MQHRQLTHQLQQIPNNNNNNAAADNNIYCTACTVYKIHKYIFVFSLAHNSNLTRLLNQNNIVSKTTRTKILVTCI